MSSAHTSAGFERLQMWAEPDRRAERASSGVPLVRGAEQLEKIARAGEDQLG